MTYACEISTYETVITEAKKFARELFTACRELARDESTVSISYIVTLEFMFIDKNSM
jgi:hypothetical protein